MMGTYSHDLGKGRVYCATPRQRRPRWKNWRPRLLRRRVAYWIAQARDRSRACRVVGEIAASQFENAVERIEQRDAKIDRLTADLNRKDAALAHIQGHADGTRGPDEPDGTDPWQHIADIASAALEQTTEEESP